MKMLNITLILALILPTVVSADTSLNYLPENPTSAPGYGIGMGGGVYGGIGGFPTGGQQPESIPIFDTSGAGQFRSVKLNSQCPLLTNPAKDDTDLFSDLKSFLSTASKKCSLGSGDGQSGIIGMNTKPNVSMFETMINGGSSGSSSYPNYSSVSSASVKCYSKNVELIGQRNMAYYYAEKKMTTSSTTTSPFASCLTMVDEMYQPVSIEKQKECIAKKYDETLEENKMICQEVNAPQAVQAQINKGLLGIEELLNQAIANKEECGFKTQDLFKVTMNTFLKTKALSVVGPWGAVAGFGVDLVGNLLDKLFPSDAQKASQLMDEILSEETFEQNACLYFNVQQKLYCEEKPIEISTVQSSCQNIEVNSDLIKLIQKYKQIKKVTDTYNVQPTVATPGFPTMANASNSFQPMGETMGMGASSISPEFESALLDHLDELANYAVANETELKNRVASLPKIQQKREQVKIDKFINKMKDYQNYDPEKDPEGMQGKKLINEIAGLFTAKSPDAQWDLATFVVKTTSGTKLESLKQRSIASTVEDLMAKQSGGSSKNESSRTMARYHKYKNGMTLLAKSKFEARLDKQFQEFEKQVKFVASKDRGVVNDTVAEGQLRNLVRHCSLLQEVYDPNLEGKMPKACQKLTCETNKLNWFKPKASQSNYTEFKQSYCDKSLGFHKVEDDYVKDLKDPSGAKICGVKAESFF